MRSSQERTFRLVFTTDDGRTHYADILAYSVADGMAGLFGLGKISAFIPEGRFLVTLSLADTDPGTDTEGVPYGTRMDPWDDGDRMTVEEFEDHDFNSDDGSGFWATHSRVSWIGTWSGERPPWATHVAWYNR